MLTLKQRFLSSVAVISLFGTQAALAADLPVKAPIVKAPIVAVPSWTGFYVGGHAGYSWGSVTGDTTNNFVAPTGFSVPQGTVLFSFERDVNPKGALGGFQAGYNFQAGQVVYGIEADLTWTGQRDSFSFSGHRADQVVSGEDFNYQETLAAKLRYMGTVRGRLGHAFGDWLPYLTGGFAWGRMTMDLNWSAVQTCCQGFVIGSRSFAGTESHTLVGWTVGAGLERAFARQWSVKAEYLYVDLGEKTFFSGIKGGGSFGLQDHIVRIGINFRT